jgi:hypothetical protein
MITRGDKEVMTKECPKTPFPITPGCSHEYPSSNFCHVFIASDEILKAVGWTYETVRRHEIGHCNGWPADHRGARAAPPAETDGSTKANK